MLALQPLASPYKIRYDISKILIASRTCLVTTPAQGYGAVHKENPMAETTAKSPRKKNVTEETATTSAGLRIRIRLKAYDHKVIDQSAKQIIDTALRTGASVAGPVPLPTRRSTFTVVKSPHVYKTGGEAFEMRVHKRLIDITNATPKTIDSLQNLSLPAGVDAEIRM